MRRGAAVAASVASGAAASAALAAAWGNPFWVVRSSRTRTEVALEDKAHDRLFGERHSRRQYWRPRRVSSRMADAPAQEEIDEPTGKFLRPRSDIAHLQLLA